MSGIIKNRELVTSIFGYWPTFADAKFYEFKYSYKSREISASIYYIDADQNKRALIALKFGGVTEVQLTDIISENVIDEIQISNESPHVIEIEACCGLCGSFKCMNIEVEGVNT